ncbi:MAG: hypothetical protein CL424_11930 [Acidimicrobiaceae bacterium]|nr:hypothetical protein [Acidimicrobiaceae bacterium]
MFASRRFLAASVAFLIASTFAIADTASAADDSYVVRPGDSIYGIAYDQGVPVSQLMSANGLEISSVILPGQRLTIPGGTTSGGATSDSGGSTPSSSPSSSPSSTYTIVAGDSLSGIAGRHGVSLTALLRANDLQISSLILPGRRLTIPGGGAPTGSAADSPNSAPAAAPTATAGTATYQIRSGDSLSGIASKHGVRLGDLLRVNGLQISSVIHPGRLLKLPAGATVPATTTTPTPAPAAPSAPTSSKTHTVVAGNSLSGIAATYGVTLGKLLEVNGMRVDSLILPGQTLKLPAGAATRPSTPAPAPTSTTPVSNATRSRIDTVVSYAMDQVGKDYAFFTKGPNSFDCSGLTLAAYRQAGIDLTHWSAAQANQGTRVDLDTDGIRAGDLVFQQRNGSLVINHVGIAIDGQRWVHAVGPGKGVRIGNLPDAGSITTVRRYIDG